MNPAELIKERDTLRCQLHDARDQLARDSATIARVTAERDHHKSVKETTDAAHKELSREHAALRARVADLEAAESLHWITEVELRQSRARVAELVAALESAAELAEGAIKLLRQLDMESGRVAAECVLRDARAALARSESATPDHIRDAAKMVSPDKHQDTERLDAIELMRAEIYHDGIAWVVSPDSGDCAGDTLRAAIDAARKQGGAA